MSLNHYRNFRKLALRVFVPTLFSILLAACAGESTTGKSEELVVSNLTLQKVFDARDQREPDSLIGFLDHEDPIVRRVAAESFASVQRTEALQKLQSLLLRDPDIDVRKAAAFAIGHSFDSASSELLISSLDVETNLQVRKIIFEGIGKCVSQSQLSEFNTLETVDLPETEGFAWGLYRAGIRGIYDELSIETSLKFLEPDQPFDIRLAASHFLARSPIESLNAYQDQIFTAIQNERSDVILSTLANSLSKVDSPEADETLISLAQNSSSMVRINALRTMRTRDNKEDIYPTLLNALQDENTNVAIAASEVISRNEWKEYLPSPLTMNMDSLNWRVRNNIVTAKYDESDSALNSWVKERFAASTNPFEKGGLLSLIGRDIREFESLVTEVFSSEDDFVKRNGIFALVNQRLDSAYPEELVPDFNNLVREVIEGGDRILLTGIQVLVRRDSTILEGVLDEEIFNAALAQVADDPYRTNQLRGLKTVILDNAEPEGFERDFRSTEWNAMTDLKDTEYLTIKTSKGDIQIELYTAEAPASVINFIQLVESGYYDNTYFHRVVPNFVIQGGSFLGDGSGVPNYTIRSEFTQRKYTTGTVGMASAGKDTESSQFFITHSPTPHLDPGYTTFGEVTEGMDVVELIEVGDMILDIERQR